jgi:hypothetical protein
MDRIIRDTWDRIDEVEAVNELDALEKAEPTPEARAATGAMHDALEWLRVEHLPFRHASQEDIRELDELRQRILEAVSQDRQLDDYYEEAWNGLLTTPSSTTAGRPAYRLVAAMQLQLMERAFYLLRLSLFASARENAGWMDLFRRWGSSPRFTSVYSDLARTVSPLFAEFYEDFLRDRMPRPKEQSADRVWEAPVAGPPTKPAIHHPWLGEGRGLYMDSGLVEAHVSPGAGGVSDSRGGGEGADKPYETPSDSVDQ